MASQPKQKADAISDVHVVDVDVHVTDSEEDIVPYLEEPYSKLLGGGGYSQAGIYPRASQITPAHTGKVKPGDASPDGIVDAMDRLGMNEVVLTPGLGLEINAVHHEELGLAMADAYNRWLLDTYLDHDASMHAHILVSGRKPRASAELIERYADEDAFAGVMLPGSAVPPLGHEWYDPIYEAAEAEGLPIVSHTGAMTVPVNTPHQWYWSKRYLTMKVPMMATEYMYHLSSIVSRGTLEKFPDLNFVIEETGIGWIPYFLERFDHVYQGNEHDAPMLQKKPSEYIHDNVFFTSQPIEGATNPDYISSVMRLMNAPENLIFTSDYPHHDFDHPVDIHTMLEKSFEEAEIRQMMGGNAEAVYDIEQ
jgi:predicted TIM-barrel fold metal-dependent hydrolase